ncbi:MAG: putative Fe-S cluster assembly protein SufT [Candidatus Xiphinematobacter sp.]|nr:MAG: putative Fe-S cluster assembly protein SufT [Candidatus Xiphinematobacter sp.]
MNGSQETKLLRDCDAIQIPSGNPLVLPRGTSVVITQMLGGAFTVATDAGLVRIEEKDADALGRERTSALEKETEEGGPSEEKVWNQLRTVFDPEIPVNVVDLGLVYDCQVIPKRMGKIRVLVKMTLTAPGCGMGPAIAADAKTKILAIDGVEDAEVELVWDPPWSQGMISEAGRMKLGLV